MTPISIRGRKSTCIAHRLRLHDIRRRLLCWVTHIQH
jgi:hypothetical protein